MPRGFAKAVSEALEEAAPLDGASRARFLRRVLFPLVLPGPVATGVFSSLSTRNDFLFAKSSVVSGIPRPPPPTAPPVLHEPDEPDRGGVMAASTVMTIPVLVFLVRVQRRPVRGPGGAVKD